MAAGNVQAQWKQLKGSLKDRWERFTDEDVKGLKGKTDELVSKVQERYGLLKDEAERQVADWVGMVKAEVGRVSRPRRTPRRVARPTKSKGRKSKRVARRVPKAKARKAPRKVGRGNRR